MESIGKGELIEAELLYRGSRDGFLSTTFHDMCDEKGSTLVLVKAKEGNRFGCYTEMPWKKAGEYYEDK